ncbi:LysR family transcriptional regulator [Thermoactinospora rubra]|uniref:LysR family transcriptional regulator n=1 Tax=Thermoactinospora rubra TaxID=1088767 RepID=UPI000A10089E|nr:LysR family transcriptional regulator [Thermoactinospora rubra]
MLDPVRLRLLCELARRGTMTAAGAACGMTSSAVSQQLATLEREARVRLLERAGRRVRLTAEGERLVRHAQAVLDALDAAEADLRAAGTPRGPVRVASFATAIVARLLPAIAAARSRHPDLHVIVHELEPGEAIEELRDGRCDVALVYSYDLLPEQPPPGVLLEPAGAEAVLVALPAAHPAVHPAVHPAAGAEVDLRLLREEEWIAGSRGSADHELAERACALAGFRPRITHTADDYAVVLRMVGHGLGAALVPEPAAQYGVPPGVRLLPIAGTRLSRLTHVATRRGNAATPAVRAIADLLAARAPSHKLSHKLSHNVEKCIEPGARAD